MAKRLTWLFALLGWLCASAPPSDAATKHAFVVGIGRYDNLGADKQLPRSLADAASIAREFKTLGFAVASGNDLTRSNFNNRWQDFLAGVASGDTVTLFFSGHGIQLDGLNYLLPRDMPKIDVTRPEQIRSEALNVSGLLADLARRKPRVTVIILDACRDNPLVPTGAMSAGAPQGLASMSAPIGTFIMFSASDGQVAYSHLPGPPNHPDPARLDPDPNSVFTRKLLPLLRQQGVTLQSLAIRTGFEVATALDGRQNPRYYDGMDPRAPPFCFAGCEAGAAQALPPPVAAPPVTPPATTSSAAREWQDVKDSASVVVLERYIARHRDDPVYAALAQDRIDVLKRQQVAALAKAEADAKKGSDPLPRPAVTNLEPSRKGSDPAAATADATRPDRVFRDCQDKDAAGQFICPEMVMVPAGNFMMGSPAGEDGRSDYEGPQRRVTFARPFAAGKFEVTFAEWDACAAAGACKSKPETSWGRGRQPVHSVSWDDITKEYLPWLNKKLGLSGAGAYRLLTEAEWEYAARAGTTTPFSFGATISTDQANYDGNSTYGNGKTGEYRQKTIEVGSLNKPNAFGLHDMHGNVWEWVQDCYKVSYSTSPTDGAAVPDTASCLRVLRGGSWDNGPQFLRSAFRYRFSAVDRNYIWGFRLARTLSPP